MLMLNFYACLAVTKVHAQIAPNWCTHRTAQRLTADVNGDGQLDAVCHDRVTGMKWIAIRESTGLVERWVNSEIRWCSHANAVLFTGDVNGDRRADLICKDPGRISVDYGGNDFFQGTDFFTDTNWCTHSGVTFSVSDENFDRRADLVCRNRDGSMFVDLADANGQFAGTDFFGECRNRSISSPFVLVANPRDNSSAQRTGDMRLNLSTVGAGDVRTETFVGTTGFSNAEQMPVFVRATPILISGRVRFTGAPGLGYAQAGSALRLVVTDAAGRELCVDEQVLNEQEGPGFNADVPLNRPRVLSCNAGVNGNFQARVFLRGWATAGGAITSSSDAHVRLTGMTSRECRSL
jgi:hypothetical protein